jgi:hypothetical protein
MAKSFNVRQQPNVGKDGTDKHTAVHGVYRIGVGYRDGGIFVAVSTMI